MLHNSPDNHNMHILCVDNDPDTLRIYQYIIHYNNSSVVIANTGEEALSALEREDFNLVLLDVQMPRLSGNELVARIRNHKNPKLRNLLLIAVTAYAMLGDRETLLTLGYDYYISKPVDVRTIFQTILSFYRHKMGERV